MPEFEVTMVCKVKKIVTVQCDDEQKAWTDPWEWATYEVETDQIDWEIVKVECTESE